MFKRWEWFLMGVLATGLFFQASEIFRVYPSQNGLSALYEACPSHVIKVFRVNNKDGFSYTCD